MPRVMPIYGTRPEAIKMAPLILELRARGYEVPVTVTGQHREMLDQVNAVFEIVPDYDLNLMQPGATLAQITERALVACTAILSEHTPDAVVVQGDTSSAFVAGLAAFYQQIPVIPLEAGLRTGNIRSPFPEEANRRLVAPLTSLHLAPTSQAKANLVAESIREADIAVTGNTVIDALQIASTREAAFSDPRVPKMLQSERRLLLVTTHRRESWGQPMIDSMSALADLARALDIDVLLPMHRNAIVRDVIEPILGGLPNVLLTEPLSYLEFCNALGRCDVVLTDSGGVQEEAPSLGKPVLVMRDNTERPEAIDAGTVELVGTDRARIVERTRRLFDDPAAYAAMSNAVNPYGDGLAGKRSVAAIDAYFGRGERLPDFAASSN